MVLFFNEYKREIDKLKNQKAMWFDYKFKVRQNFQKTAYNSCRNAVLIKVCYMTFSRQ